MVRIETKHAHTNVPYGAPLSNSIAKKLLGELDCTKPTIAQTITSYVAWTNCTATPTDTSTNPPKTNYIRQKRETSDVGRKTLGWTNANQCTCAPTFAWTPATNKINNPNPHQLAKTTTTIARSFDCMTALPANSTVPTRLHASKPVCPSILPNFAVTNAAENNTTT